jgi:hypothetical protein
MSPRDDFTSDSVQSYAEQWVAETPFLQTLTPDQEEDPRVAHEQEAPVVNSWYESETPFREGQELEGGYGLEAEDLAELLAELEHEGFNDAVNRLVNEASELYQEQFLGESGVSGRTLVEPERLLLEHFEPLARETERLLDEMAQEMERHDVSAMSEAEADTLLNRYEVPRDQLPPNHEYFVENFLGKLKRLAKGALRLAKKGVGAIAKFALGPIFKKLKGLVRPLLKRVLKFALNRLPASLRPIAQKLANRLPFLREASEGEAYEEEASAEMEAAPDPTRIQAEFDAQVAELLFAGEGTEQEVAIAEYAAEAEQLATDPVGELDRARAEFISEVSRLSDGEDPALVRQLENFIPAIYPIAKGAITLIGRGKVVNFIAKFLAKLISRFVGKEHGLLLARAITDVGLSALRLEAPPEQRAGVAAEALAATVEETMRRLPDLLSEEELNDEALLEGAVLEAFEGAAAACLPATLLKPRLRETTGLNGAWVFWPAAAKRYRCRKYTLIPNVRITPQIARAVMAFGGIPLARILRDRYGLSEDRSVDARLHLYEATPGATTHEIVRSDKDNVPGLGASAELLQPLTPEAAMAFLQEPELGREVSSEYLDSSDQLALGQRLYYLEIPGARPQVVPTGPGRPHAARRASHVHLKLDFPRNRIQVYIFLSEAASQEIASLLRQRAPAGVVLSRLKAEYARDLNAALSGRLNRRVKLVHEAVVPDQFLGLGTALKRVHPKYLQLLRRRLHRWLRQRLVEHLQQQAQKLIAATENPADGVTLVVTFTNPPGLPNLRSMLGGGSATVSGGGPPKGMPETSIEVVPGHFRG